MVNAHHANGRFIEREGYPGVHSGWQSSGTCKVRNYEPEWLLEVEKTLVILSCPSCSSQYFADDSAIGETGRMVRCAACGHAWFAKPELSLEQEIDASGLSREQVERMRQSHEAPAEVSPHMAIRERELAKKRTGSRLAAAVAWTGSAAIFFAAGATAVVQRDAIVDIWPQASTAYAMAGLDVNPFGLEFTSVDAQRTFEGTTPVLDIRGSVLNITEAYRSSPEVRVDLRDDNGRDIDSVLIVLDSDVVPPGGEALFSARLDAPPLEAFDLAVSFVKPDGNNVAQGGYEMVDVSPQAVEDTPEGESYGGPDTDENS